MYDYSYYHELQSAKMREMENQARDRSGIHDLMNEKVSTECHRDMVRCDNLLRRAACLSWITSDVGPSAMVAFNAQFVSALEEDK